MKKRSRRSAPRPAARARKAGRSAIDPYIVKDPEAFARAIDVSHHTVHYHLTNAVKKLDAKNKIHAATMAADVFMNIPPVR